MNEPNTKAGVSVAAINQHDDLLDALRSLGLVAVTPAQVSAAIKEIYPAGVKDIDQGEVLRAVFLHLRAQGFAR